MKGFKKLGILFLVLVVALAGVGAAFAAWTDTLTIQGTVNTGSVDIEIVSTSGTEVYKDLSDDSMDVCYYFETDGNKTYHPIPPWGGTTPPDNGLLVAYADGNITADDEITFEFQNIFPGPVFVVDAKFHYVGTVPAHISDIDVQVNDPDNILDVLDIDYFAYRWDPVKHEVGDPVGPDVQLHNSDWIWAGITIHVPQDNDLMGKSASGTITIELKQWNEAPVPTPVPTPD